LTRPSTTKVTLVIAAVWCGLWLLVGVIGILLRPHAAEAWLDLAFVALYMLGFPTSLLAFLANGPLVLPVIFVAGFQWPLMFWLANRVGASLATWLGVAVAEAQLNELPGTDC
jgi:cellulose synthase/poly-beta-1,6-N-acetylglucosamine synthase-like glycosyltransferase